eukprot:1401072-Rhodomonas_salina.1
MRGERNERWREGWEKGRDEREGGRQSNLSAETDRVLSHPQSLPAFDRDRSRHTAAHCNTPQDADLRAMVSQVTKRDLQPRSVLMATPLLFTTRVMPTAECPFKYSRRLVQEQHARVLSIVLFSLCLSPSTHARACSCSQRACSELLLSSVCSQRHCVQAMCCCCWLLL